MQATNQLSFSRVRIGDTFYQNGNTYEKKSTRTAHLIEYDRRFYFASSAQVTVNDETCKHILQSESN